MSLPMSRLSFAPYDAARDGEVRDLFTEYNFKDYQLSYMGVPKDRMADYLESTLKSENTHSITLRGEDRIVGLIALQSLPWMSKHFGLRMYAVSHLLANSHGPLFRARLLRYVVEELPEVDFLDCRVAVDDVFAAHALEVCGFRYVGTEMYMGQRLTLKDPPEPHPEFEITPCRIQDREQVLRIASETHIHNRFVYDPVINTAAAKSLYRRLVENCFDSKHFSVLVARDGDLVQGFIVSKLNPAFSKVVGMMCGSLDFIGVRPESRSKGLGGALNDWALYDMVQEGAQYAAVRTLGSNYPAMGTCYKTGFRVTSTSLHFHRWIHRPARSEPAVYTGPVNLMKLAKSVRG